MSVRLGSYIDRKVSTLVHGSSTKEACSETLLLNCWQKCGMTGEMAGGIAGERSGFGSIIDSRRDGVDGPHLQLSSPGITNKVIPDD